jgi:hypothetical protein
MASSRQAFPYPQGTFTPDFVLRINQWQWSLLIFALTLVVHFTFYRLTGLERTFEFNEMEKIARSLATENVFGNPYALPTGPSAHHAPIYPFVLSLIFRIFGYGPDAKFIQAFINIAFVALQMALLPYLSRIANLPLAVGVLAGFIGALVPLRVFKETRFESSLSGLAAVVFVIVLLRWLQTEHPSAWNSILAGVVSGLCVLATPPLLLVALALIVAWFFLRPRKQVLILAIAFGAALLPWTVRNFVQLGGLVPLRSNYSLELSVSNEDDSHPQSNDNFRNPVFRHPSTSEAEAIRVQQLGEVGYNRERALEARSWILNHPQRFLALTALRTVYFWFPPYPLHQFYKCLFDYPITILGVVGLYRMLQQRLPLGNLFGMLFLIFPAVYYPIEADTRYRYPIDWAFLFLASYAVFVWLASRQWSRSPITR